MSRFRQGMFIGVILSVLITLAIALTLNDTWRRQLSYRFEQLKQSAQEAASKARETGSNLSEQVQESAGKLVQHTQEIRSTVQQKGASLGDQQETKRTV
jgi:hypothetical protein